MDRARAVLLAVLTTLLACSGTVLGLSAAPAGAATCTSAGGVSVVVDQRELGGGILTACVADGGGQSASRIFAAAGVAITYASRQPGFVCRVNGAPASDPCVNTSPPNAYWGLWYGDGSSASWTYSSQGVQGLTVPAGGSVGFAWQQDRGSSPVPPGVAVPVHEQPAPSPTKSPSPTNSPTKSPSPTKNPSPTESSPSPTKSPTPTSSPTTSASPTPGATGSPSRSTSPSPAQRPTRKPARKPSAKPSDRASASDSASPLPTESPSDSGASGSGGTTTDDTRAVSDTTDEPARIPAYVTWGVLGLLAVGILASGLVARRRRGA